MYELAKRTKCKTIYITELFKVHEPSTSNKQRTKNKVEVIIFINNI